MHEDSDTPGWSSLATEHEQVAFFRDAASGLRAIVAIHSTALGPALGGTRFHPYPTVEAALRDVLDLSRAMTYKNALAGLDHGGGKAVIIGDPRRDKSEALLRAYGRCVQSLAGRYVTACDVGTYVKDMDVVARESDHVTGRSEADGGAGDSSVLTAVGVHQGMRAAATHRWGSPDLSGRLVGISGVGKVGRHLTGLLIEDGAKVVVTDPVEAAVAGVVDRYSDVHAVPDHDALLAEPLEIYSPNAMGGALDDDVAERLTAAIVCGAANNQLAHPAVADRLHERGVLYCPDYLVNSGGVIQVSDELRGFSFERARERTRSIYDITVEVLQESADAGVSPEVAAGRRAERRIAEIGQARMWLAGRGRRP